MGHVKAFAYPTIQFAPSVLHHVGTFSPYADTNIEFDPNPFIMLSLAKDVSSQQISIMAVRAVRKLMKRKC